MKQEIEKTYGSAVRKIFFAVNPLKKKIMKTNCTVHKFIIIRAIEILKNDNYMEEYEFFRKHVKRLNAGVTWADQDFKSSNHFYHVSKGKGLYGFSDALTECEKYYDKSIQFLKNKEVERALFYFGASCHLIQDVTVPHHVNNKLLNSHRRFELWIIGRLMTDYSFVAEEGAIVYDKVEDFVKNNAIMANSVYMKNINIQSRDERYSKVAATIIKEAERTTAGFMIKYYRELKKL
ncbi:MULTISPECIES: zinc dependent phospholipase C family protein [Clostridium]|uniref:Phospholipase C n=2 Tax=Clostridium TaxID=1485 RepID=D8GKC2_CLOLD|nr:MULTISPECIES: zinc dependent phospholipase C family protein [Clostridium]ADK15262.1 zinc dependent phospholipase C [Clostridium ljungdahlii DSM 13528]OAA88744.1 Zinc dependent phospholipase C [Clostridium ljungdahlii DSM 13528]OAA94901.1 Zinc dependent phospholipase C [Clostridium coskatii]OBR91641.1 zinc dependent phospholipase C [Clostridium coskatii]